MPSGAERALTRERLQRRRDALLLELGALVYELHRHGRRAPELLQKKAGELEALDAELAGLEAAAGKGAPAVPAAAGAPGAEAGAPRGEAGGPAEAGASRAEADAPAAVPAGVAAVVGPAASSPCPSCGEPAERGQLVCLNCGARLALERQPRRLLPLVAAVTAVVVLGAGAFGFAISELTGGDDGADEGVAAAERRSPPQPSAETGEAQPTRSETAPSEPRAETAPSEPPAETAPSEPPTDTTPGAQPETGTETAPGTPQRPARSLLLDWPEDLRAHTVVLVTTSDRAAARRVARGAARSGIETGLLNSNDYDLGSDLWIVFAGRFDTRRGAERQAADLADRYPGAYVQLIEPRG